MKKTILIIILFIVEASIIVLCLKYKTLLLFAILPVYLLTKRMTGVYYSETLNKSLIRHIIEALKDISYISLIQSVGNKILSDLNKDREDLLSDYEKKFNSDVPFYDNTMNKIVEKLEKWKTRQRKK